MNLALLRSELAASAPFEERIIELWLEGKADTTRVSYTKDIVKFRALLDCPLILTRYENLVEFCRLLEAQGYSARSRHRTLAAVKSLLTFCHAQGWTLINVAAAYRLPPVDALELRCIPTQEQVLSMLEGAPSLRDRLLLALLYYGGLRIGETCSLHWHQVHFRLDWSSTLRVVGKGNKLRYVALAPFETGLLREWHPNCLPLDSDSRVLRITDRHARRIIDRIAVTAGISSGLSPHSFRHAHASHSQDNGELAHVVQKTLGHSDPRTTTGYTHISTTISSGRMLQRPASG